MKKIFVLSLIALLVLAFGTMAFAQAKKDEPTMQFKASGWIDAQFNSFKNATPGRGDATLFGVGGTNTGAYPSAYAFGGAAYDQNVSYWQSRARLRFDWMMGKQSSATMIFELDSDRWGDIAGDRNTMGYWSADRAAVEVKNIYFDFALPAIIPVPVSFRVGLQPLSIRPNILVYTDGMGIIGSVKVDPANIQLLYFKARENSASGRDQTADDVNVYGLHANAKIGTVTAGGYALYYNMNQYPFGSLDNNADMWWFGVYADGKVGPVNLNFDFIYDRGEIERRGSLAARPDVKYRGWATRAKVDFPWEKFNFGGVFHYASGADLKKTDQDGIPGNLVAYGTGAYSTKVGSYVVPVGSEAGAIYGESVVMYSFWANRGTTGIANSNNYTNLCRGPVGGTWMAKGYASFKATPWYKVTLQGLYIGDTTKNGNTFGNAVKRGSNIPRDDKEIGWEVDIINEIEIYKNLKFVLAGGYLWAGDALDFRRALGVNDSPKNPWNITGNLTYSF